MVDKVYSSHWKFLLTRGIALLCLVTSGLACKAAQGFQISWQPPAPPETTPGASETPGGPPRLQATPTKGESPGDLGLWAQATITPGVGFKQRFYPAGQIGGNTYALGASGAYAYLGVGPRLLAVELSDPANPRWVGQTDTLPGVVRGIALREPYAFVAAGKGHLRVIDLSNPQQPKEVSALEEFQWAMGVWLDGDRLYVADNALGLWIADVSNPIEPRLLGSFKLKKPAAALAGTGNQVYVVDMNGGLSVFDVSDPAAPRLTGELPLPQLSSGIALCGGYACVAAGVEGLWVVDVSDPSAPRKLGGLRTPYANGIAVKGNLAYLADAVQGLIAIDVSNPQQPVQAGLLPLMLFSQGVPGNRQLVILDGRLLMAHPNQGMMVIGVSDPARMNLAGRFDAPMTGTAFDSLPLQDSVYVTRDFIGLGSVQASDPANLRFLGSERSFVDGAPVRTSWKFALHGGYAVMADVNLGFRVVARDSFEQAAAIDKPQSWRSVIVEGQTAYATTTEHDPKAGDPEARRSLRLVDISNPTQPRQIGFLKMEHNAEAIALQGQYLFYPDALEMKEQKEGERSALHVIDVSNPSSPLEVGQLDLTEHCPRVSSLVIKGNVAYLGDPEQGLCLVEISTPSAPVLAGTWKELPSVYDLALVGDRIFIAGYAFVAALDISQPTAPSLEDITVTPGLAWGISADERWVYVADMDGGLNILGYR